ncbi:MAG: twin-arginine translocation signal domain-containing protein, partial [Pirellulales bacterium]
MSNLYLPHHSLPDTSRRQFLKSAALRTSALGFGNLALGALLQG